MNHKRPAEAILRMGILEELGISISNEEREKFMHADSRQLERLATNLIERHYDAINKNDRIKKHLRERKYVHRERLTIDI